jgi:hypothetical protein
MDTQFDNPSGAYSTKQYASAHDCAVIMQGAMRYQLIKDALMLRNTTAIAKTKKDSRKVLFKSTNPLLVSQKPSEVYKFTKGGISGTMGSPVNGTQYAGVATVDDMQLIVVLMNSKESKIAYEAKGLLVYGDTKVTKNTIVQANKKVGSVRVRGGASTRAAVYTETNGFVYVPPEGTSSLVDTQVIIYNDVEAPLREGDKVGEFRIYVADELKGTVDLVIKKDIKKGWPPSQIYISNRAVIIAGAIVLLLLLAKLRIRQINKKRAKRREAMRQRRIRELAREQLVVDEDRRKRNWTFDSGNYDKLPPRTSDIRKEAIDAALREENEMKAELSGSKTDRKRAELNRRISKKKHKL